MELKNTGEMLESNFTEPREDCPNPHYWHSDDNESTEWEVIDLLVGFINALQPEFVLETGTAFGAATFAIGTALIKNGHGRCVSVETDMNRVVAAQYLCKGLPVEIVCADAISYVPSELIDFAWVDTGGNRAQELLQLRQFLKPQAIIGVHDTGPQHLVWRDIEAAGVLNVYNHIKLPTPRGVAFLCLK